MTDELFQKSGAHRKRLNLRDLKGQGGIREDYDYKSLREGKPVREKRCPRSKKL